MTNSTVLWIVGGVVLLVIIVAVAVAVTVSSSAGSMVTTLEKEEKL